MQKIKHIICILLILNALNVFSQNPLSQKYTIEFNNKPFKKVITELSTITSLNFCYNANIIPQNTPITGKFTNETLEIILTTILKKYNISFYYQNNQLILKKQPDNSNTTNKQVNQNKKETSLFYDTMKLITPVFDTIKILKYDTVKTYIVDTIIKYDTIKVTIADKKSKTIVPSLDRKAPVSISLFTSVYFGPAFYSLKSNNANNTDSLQKSLTSAWVYSAAVGGNIQLKRLGFYVGLGIAEFKVNYKDSKYTHVGYFRTDTVLNNDSTGNYKIVQTLLDSSIQVLYEVPQTFRYLVIPLHISYNFELNKNTSVEIKAGASIQFLIQYNGYSQTSNLTIKKIGESELTPNPIIITWYSSFCLNKKINDKWSFFIEPYFQKNISSLFSKQNWYEQYITNIGLGAGLKFIIK